MKIYSIIDGNNTFLVQEDALKEFISYYDEFDRQYVEIKELDFVCGIHEVYSYGYKSLEDFIKCI